LACWLREKGSASVRVNSITKDLGLLKARYVMAENFDNGLQGWIQGMRKSNLLEEAVQRLRFKNSWTKADLCRYLDVKPSELHKYFNGEIIPPESFLLIIKNELEKAGGFERRGKIRPIELLDRIIELERRVEQLEQRKESGDALPVESSGHVSEAPMVE